MTRAGDVCAICHSALSADQSGMPVRTPCRHVFHGQCIREWCVFSGQCASGTESPAECPMCRSVILLPTWTGRIADEGEAALDFRRMLCRARDRDTDERELADLRDAAHQLLRRGSSRGWVLLAECLMRQPGGAALARDYYIRGACEGEPFAMLYLATGALDGRFALVDGDVTAIRWLRLGLESADRIARAACGTALLRIRSVDPADAAIARACIEPYVGRGIKQFDDPYNRSNQGRT